MSLIRMSFSASLMIIVILIIRTLLINKLPKKVFSIFWIIVLLRLLIPFSCPSMFSIYFLISQNPTVMNKIADTPITCLLPISSYEHVENSEAPLGDNIKEENKMKAGNTEKSREQNADTRSPFSQEAENGLQKKWVVIWIIGLSISSVIFSVIYFSCWKQFRTSLPVKNAMIKEWLLSHKIKRTISIRQSDCIVTPLAYGFIHPVILLPKTIKWQNHRQIQYILEHEFIHIRRLDAATKLFLIAAVCIHWFNPFVWVLYIFANRDIELSCDETVVRHFGEDSKSAYAMSLIYMEETKSTPISFGNPFSRNTAEERITAIMKIQHPSVIADILSFALIVSVTAAFTTSSFSRTEQGMDSIKTAQHFDIQNATIFAKGRNLFSFLKAENAMDVQRSEKEKQPEDFFHSLTIIDVQTKLFPKQQKELLKAYQKHGIYEYNTILYYQNRPIRCLIDKYQEETVNKYGGKNYNTIRIYTYFNEKGSVDVQTIRENKIGKTMISELYRNVKGVVSQAPVTIESVLADLPRKSVNKLAQKAASEGRYRDLDKLVPFTDTNIVEEIAERYGWSL